MQAEMLTDTLESIEARYYAKGRRDLIGDDGDPAQGTRLAARHRVEAAVQAINNPTLKWWQRRRAIRAATKALLVFALTP